MRQSLPVMKDSFPFFLNRYYRAPTPIYLYGVNNN